MKQIVSGVVLTFMLLNVGILFSTTPAFGQLKAEPADQTQKALQIFSSMPLCFTPNSGQFSEGTLFEAKTQGVKMNFQRDGVSYIFARDMAVLSKIKSRAELTGLLKNPTMLKIETRFLGANPFVNILGDNKMVASSNYFLGNNPNQWRTDVPNFEAVVYKEIYPGIDLRYYGNQQSLKYDFIVYPGADYSLIRIQYDGVENLRLSATGILEGKTAYGTINERAPYIYQDTPLGRKEIFGQYEIFDQNTFGFKLESGYNPWYPLTIDPELNYSTYLGGSSSDGAYAVAVNDSGYTFITGYTLSTNFPTKNPYDPSYNGSYDVFVSKIYTNPIDPPDALIYSTYLGGATPGPTGTPLDIGRGIAIDALGNAYIGGETWSLDFPTVNPFDGNLTGDGDAFVSKLSVGGNNLLYSTYLGGGDEGGGDFDGVTGIAVDDSNDAYVTGLTRSGNFPTLNPYDNSYNSFTDAFVAKIRPSPGGAYSLLYSSYFGGQQNDEGQAIAVDRNHNAYITGETESANLPTRRAYDAIINGSNDVFVAKFSPSLNGDPSFIYGTYLGGDSSEFGSGIAVDTSGNAYITGSTGSSSFPTVNAYDPSYNGGEPRYSGGDIFVSKFSLPLSGNLNLVYSTFFGGSAYDLGTAISVNGNGSAAYITGQTRSVLIPRVDPYDGYYNGSTDVYVATFNPSLSGRNSLLFGTFFGGSNSETGWGIANNPNGTIYFVGETQSSNFPLKSPYDNTLGGTQDAFLSKLSPTGRSCNYIPGDANGDGLVIGSDVTFMVNYFHGSGSVPPILCNCTGYGQLYVGGDANGSCTFIGSDVTYLVAYFNGGPAPVACPACTPTQP